MNTHPPTRCACTVFFCAWLASVLAQVWRTAEAVQVGSATNTHPPARCPCTVFFVLCLLVLGLVNSGSYASSPEDFSAQLCMQKKCKTASNSTTTTTTQQQVNALSAQLPGQLIGMSLPLLLRHHLRPTAALLLVRRRLHPAGLPSHATHQQGLTSAQILSRAPTAQN